MLIGNRCKVVKSLCPFMWKLYKLLDYSRKCWKTFKITRMKVKRITNKYWIRKFSKSCSISYAIYKRRTPKRKESWKSFWNGKKPKGMFFMFVRLFSHYSFVYLSILLYRFVCFVLFARSCFYFFVSHTFRMIKLMCTNRITKKHISF